MRFRTHFTFRQDQVLTNEKPSQPSMTIEGETRSLKQLIQQMANGMIPLTRRYEYVDTEDVDNMTSLHRQPLDLTELDDVRNKVASDRQAIEDHKAKKAAFLAAKKAAAERQAAVDEYIAMQNKQRKDGPDHSSSPDSGN